MKKKKPQIEKIVKNSYEKLNNINPKLKKFSLKIKIKGNK